MQKPFVPFTARISIHCSLIFLAALCLPAVKITVISRLCFRPGRVSGLGYVGKLEFQWNKGRSKVIVSHWIMKIAHNRSIQICQNKF
jgi:hypothetical protein